MKFIFKRYKNQIQDYFVRDFLEQIPDAVTDPALVVTREHARKLDKLTRYMAYEIHRKMAADTRNTERYQGMLIAFKLMNAMIGSVPDELPTVSPRKEELSSFAKAMNGIKAFKEKAFAESAPTTEEA